MRGFVSHLRNAAPLTGVQAYASGRLASLSEEKRWFGVRLSGLWRLDVVCAFMGLLLYCADVWRPLLRVRRSCLHLWAAHLTSFPMLCVFVCLHRHTMQSLCNYACGNLPEFALRYVPAFLSKCCTIHCPSWRHNPADYSLSSIVT